MSIGWRNSLREFRMDFLRSTTDDEGHLNARLKWRSPVATASLEWTVGSARLIKGIVNAVVVVVVQVLTHEPPQVVFVQCDDMVKELASAASDPALSNPVLPWCLNSSCPS